MIIAAEIAFAIAAVLIGQIFVLRRRTRTQIAVLRYAPNFDAVPPSMLIVPDQSTVTAPVSAASVAATPAAAAGAVPDARSTWQWPWERGTSTLEAHTRDDATVHDAEPVAAVAESPNIAVTASPVSDEILYTAPGASDPIAATIPTGHEPNPVVAPSIPTDLVAVPAPATSGKRTVAFPWFKRLFSREPKAAPLALSQPEELDEATSEPIAAPETMHRAPERAEAAPDLIVGADDARVVDDVPAMREAPAAEVEDDIQPVFGIGFGLSDEARQRIEAEIAANAAASTPDASAAVAGADTSSEPVAAVPEPVTEPVAEPEPTKPERVLAEATSAASPASEVVAPSITPQEALAEATRRASAWASEMTQSSQAVPLEKRKRLLEYYGAQIDDPEVRELIERVEREDPDLRSLAADLLRGHAA